MFTKMVIKILALIALLLASSCVNACRWGGMRSKINK